jgi:hypothetical protein
VKRTWVAGFVGRQSCRYLQILLPLLRQDVRRGPEVPGPERQLPRQPLDGVGLAGSRPGVAAIQEHLQVRPLGDTGEEPSQLVVHDVDPVPVHVVGAEDLVQPVLQLVPVPVPYSGVRL